MKVTTKMVVAPEDDTNMNDGLMDVVYVSKTTKE